jgi:NitT/TauT family transport system substrate-binding protein
MEKKHIGIITAVLVIVFLSGCLTVPEQSTEEPFKISFTTWIGYGPLFVAEEKGFFGDLDVEIIQIEENSQILAALAGERIDGSSYILDTFVRAKAQGLPLVVVSIADESFGGDGIVASQEIKTVSDLKGKKVAVQRNFIGESFLFFLLEKEGIDPSEVEIIDMETGQAGAAFVAGQVDAAVTWEPWLSKAKEREDGHVLITSRETPGTIIDVFVVREKVMREKPEQVRKFVAGWFKAVEFVEENPDEAVEIMARRFDLPPEEFKELMAGVKWPSKEEALAFMQEDSEPNVFQVAEIYSKVFKKVNAIETEPKISDAVDSSALEAVVSGA